jgi:putative endonuclease
MLLRSYADYIRAIPQFEAPKMPPVIPSKSATSLSSRLNRNLFVIPTESQPFCHPDRSAAKWRDLAIENIQRYNTLVKTYYVYIMTNKSGTLYVGLTNNIKRRVYEHKIKAVPGFTCKYSIDRLIYFETHSDAVSAIAREKQIKPWRREKKLNLIKSQNPALKDLSEDWSD